MKRKYETEEDAVECPICNELLSMPIHQCKNGHLACGTCSKKLTEKECPFCRTKPFAHSRNLAMENVIKSLWTTCEHAPDGCKEVVKVTEKEIHATECEYRKLPCVATGCFYRGRKLSMTEHFGSDHNAKTVQLSPTTRRGKFKLSMCSSMRIRYVLVKADKELLLLHVFPASVFKDFRESVRHLVSAFFCSSFGDDSLIYSLTVTAKGEEGTSSVSFRASVLNHQTYDLGRSCHYLDYWASEVKNYVILPNVSRSAELDL